MNRIPITREVLSQKWFSLEQFPLGEEDIGKIFWVGSYTREPAVRVLMRIFGEGCKRFSDKFLFGIPDAQFADNGYTHYIPIATPPDLVEEKGEGKSKKNKYL